MTPHQQLRLVLARLDAAGRGIVLFHDTKPQTAAMMPAFLRALKARGYRVVHVVAAGAPANLPASGSAGP
jgi:peptidoglycan/xylan/chitin deacetylase (PgdA/CDA1 family)